MKPLTAKQAISQPHPEARRVDRAIQPKGNPMKTITTLALLMLGTAASAFPAHEPNGYRDTGCDPAQQVQITNDAGEYLYSNNPTCPAVGGPSDAERAAAAVVAEAPEEEDEIKVVSK